MQNAMNERVKITISADVPKGPREGRVGVSSGKRRYFGFRSRLDRNSPAAFVHSQARSYADTPRRGFGHHAKHVQTLRDLRASFLLPGKQQERAAKGGRARTREEERLARSPRRQRDFFSHDQSVELGFELCSTKIKKRAEPQALSVKPSVDSVRVFLLPENRDPLGDTSDVAPSIVLVVVLVLDRERVLKESLD
jgi:hypothetical protein